jgi:hypothetical protein
MPRFSTDGDLIPDGYEFNCDGDLVKHDNSYTEMATQYLIARRWDMPMIRKYGQIYDAAKTDPVLQDLLEKAEIYYNLKYGNQT